MARPKRDPNNASAAERIESSFWSMLEEGPYSSITIASLAKRANVNHNTIYYYYDNIDDMALKLFDKNIILDLPAVMLTYHTDELHAFYSNPDTKLRAKRNRLFARGDSPFLLNHLKQTIIRLWLQNADIKEENLSIENRIELEFIFSGFIAILGSSLIEDDLSQIPAMLNRPLFQSILATLDRLSHQ